MVTDQDMLFEQILELALKDKLVLWAGAGLSREAGYPTGSELAEILWAKLTDEEKRAFSKDLLKISDCLENRGKNGRDELISILKDVFSIEPKQSRSHEIIKKMAFFRTIITTNYDEMFERYIPEIHVIKNTKALSRSNTKARKLIKIHGDLKSPKRLVLTQTDYARLYERDSRDPFWNLIRVELTQKGVLFIGYGLNDSNVLGLFDHLNRRLKKHKHPKFLIAPNISEAGQEHFKKFDIQYLDFTARDFLVKLYEEVWKVQGHKFFEESEVPADSLLDALRAEGLPVRISTKKEGGRLVEFKVDPGTAINLTFNTLDHEVKHRIEEWKNGLGDDALIIPRNKIAGASLKIGDFVIGDKSTLPELNFVRVPKVFESVRVVFENSGIDLENLRVSTLRYGKMGIKMKVVNLHATFEIVIPEYTKSGFTYHGNFTPKDKCESVSELLKWQDALFALGSGEPFTIFSPLIPEGFQVGGGPKSKDLEVISRNRLVFQVLRKIEEKFRVRFFGFTEDELYEGEMLDTLQEFLDLFRTQRLEPDFSKGLPVRSFSNTPEKDLIPFLNQAREDGYLIAEFSSRKVKLLGREIDLGRSQLVIKNPILVNDSSMADDSRLVSRDSEIFMMYESFGLARPRKGAKKRGQISLYMSHKY